MTFRPRRSALFMPGSNTRALEKARTLDCDVVILDLEDAVAPDQKVQARANVLEAVRCGGFGQREVVIRINGMATPWHHDDLAAAIAAAPDAILLPKIESPLDLAAVGKALAARGADPRTRLWAMIETPLAVLNVSAIAEAAARTPASRLACLVLGTNDLAKQCRAAQTPSRGPMLFALSAAVLAARAYGIDVLDGVYNDFRDPGGLRREALQGSELGMDGKTLIHPSQIAIANEIFAPSADEIAAAHAIVAAFDKPENSGKGVISLDGRMVELLHLEIARQTLARAGTVSGRGSIS
mgnify:CR=1 FL=1